MQRTHHLKSAIALVAAALVAVPFSPGPVSAARGPAHLDQEVIRRLESTPPSELIPVIVQGGDAARVEARVREGGGKVVGRSDLLGASAAELTPAQIRSLSTDPAVQRIDVDADVTATALLADEAPSTGTPVVFDQTIGATEVWQAGDTGQGVGVAVLDSGIDNQDPAAFGARVTARVDLVDPAHPAAGDPAGHGTHVAGIVAANRSFPSPGVAPDASLVSVRVLDEGGHGRVSRVIRGLEWVIAHKNQLGIRVVVMALGAPAVSSYHEDPLAAAAEMAWRSGLVVVVAAGNDGPTARTITTPGFDPLVLTVGAADESGTSATRDDVIPSWSSEGPTLDGLAKPDVVAPGRKIVSARVPGSTIDLSMPTHVEGPLTFRLSGTSEATGVAAGAATLLVAQRPHLSPDEVKALLTRSASKLQGVSASAQGSGEIDAARAFRTRTPEHAAQSARPSDGLLRLLFSLGPTELAEVLQVNGDRVNWDRVNWDRVNWDQVDWDRVNWDRVNWDRVNWDRVNWDRVNWDQVNSDRVNWDRVNWDRVNWDQAPLD